MTTPAADLTDTVLIGRFLHGDEVAFRALYRRHAGRVRLTILRLLGPRGAEADDVLQDAWVAACRALRQYRGTAQFSTWLMAIAIREARRRLTWSDATLAIGDDDLPARSADPLGVIDLERALAQLPDAHRAVVVLHDVEGYTHDEIASALGIAAGTSRSLLTRSRRLLRRLLSAETI